MLDYDGTLAPFHTDRNAAVPYPGVRDAIRAILAADRTRVVLVSGRPPEEVRDLLAVDPPPEIWGVHGQRRLSSDGRADVFRLGTETLQILRDATELLRAHEYLDLAEVKPGSVAVHWRGLPAERAAELEGAIRQLWDPLTSARGIALLAFDGGLELRPAEPNKGTAVLTLVSELPSGSTLAYLGDDTTDEDAFAALSGSGALTVLVRTEWRPTRAQVWIRPPEELLWFLKEWQRQCSRST